MDNLHIAHLLRGEISAGKLCGAQEFVEGALLRNTAHLHPGGFLVRIGNVGIAVHIRTKNGIVVRYFLLV